MKSLLGAAMMKTRWGKKMVGIQGRATPLFWADGIFRSDELDEYQRCGLNAVVVRLGWYPAADGALAAADLLPQRRFAEAAAARGLQVIYALPAAPRNEERGFRVSADSEAYFTLWTAWVEGAIGQLKDTPNLCGWMLPDDPRSLPFFDDVGWKRWLKLNFGATGPLNAQWKTSFRDFDEITLDVTRQMIEAERGMKPLGDEFTPEELRAQLEAATKKLARHDWAFHPAALALARFKWDAYRQLLAAWADVVRGADPNRAILSGRLPDYAQLLATPANIDGLVADIRPGFAEQDVLSHNPQAIDIARRGGRFAAFTTLETDASPVVAREKIALLMPSWADAALAHGASGIAFSSWPALLDNDDLRRSVRETLARLNGVHAALWQQAPIATSAIVLTPLADGFTMRPTGVSDPLATGDAAAAFFNDAPRGLYGFGDDMVSGEPNDLVFALRWGTAFGSIDYLAPDDIDAAGQTLMRYSLLLLPQALSIDGGEAGALARYAESGGTLVADLGAGATQAGGVVAQMPPSISQLFGLPPLWITRNRSFNLKLLQPHPMLPTWSSLFHGQSGAPLTSGDGPQGAAFSGPLGYAIALPGAREIALGDEWIQPIGRRGGALLTRPMRSSLSISDVGRGHAIFAPFRLWNLWRPGQNGFDAFHGDLLAHNAALALAGARGLVPSPPGANEAQAPEIINFAGAVAVLNHAVPRVDDDQSGSQSTLEGTPIAEIQTGGVGDFVWSGGVTTFDASANFDVAAGRVAPIEAPAESETRSQPVTLFASPKAGEMQVLRLLPLRAQNLSGGALSVAAEQWQASGARIFLWPNATDVTMHDGRLQPRIGTGAPLRLTLINTPADSDDYRIAPNSRHQVSITDLSAAPRSRRNSNSPVEAPASRTITRIVAADARGRLVIECDGAALVVEIALAR